MRLMSAATESLVVAMLSGRRVKFLCSGGEMISQILLPERLNLGVLCRNNLSKALN